eukprot:m.372834 g.372834  ORF g.372834 m.372834 type:complete len:596 (+) comp56147_c0_seq31:797-2584(+)
MVSLFYLAAFYSAMFRTELKLDGYAPLTALRKAIPLLDTEMYLRGYIAMFVLTILAAFAFVITCFVFDMREQDSAEDASQLSRFIAGLFFAFEVLLLLVGAVFLFVEAFRIKKVVYSDAPSPSKNARGASTDDFLRGTDDDARVQPADAELELNMGEDEANEIAAGMRDDADEVSKKTKREEAPSRQLMPVRVVNEEGLLHSLQSIIASPAAPSPAAEISSSRQGPSVKPTAAISSPSLPSEAPAEPEAPSAMSSSKQVASEAFLLPPAAISAAKQVPAVRPSVADTIADSSRAGPWSPPAQPGAGPPPPPPAELESRSSSKMSAPMRRSASRAASDIQADSSSNSKDAKRPQFVQGGGAIAPRAQKASDGVPAPRSKRAEEKESPAGKPSFFLKKLSPRKAESDRDADDGDGEEEEERSPLQESEMDEARSLDISFRPPPEPLAPIRRDSLHPVSRLGAGSYGEFAHMHWTKAPGEPSQTVWVKTTTYPQEIEIYRGIRSDFIVRALGIVNEVPLHGEFCCPFDLNSPAFAGAFARPFVASVAKPSDVNLPWLLSRASSTWRLLRSCTATSAPTVSSCSVIDEPRLGASMQRLI